VPVTKQRPGAFLGQMLAQTRPNLARWTALSTVMLDPLTFCVCVGLSLGASDCRKETPMREPATAQRFAPLFVAALADGIYLLLFGGDQAERVCGFLFVAIAAANLVGNR
jgi:hypothetical protein